MEFWGAKNFLAEGEVETGGGRSEVATTASGEVLRVKG